MSAAYGSARFERRPTAALLALGCLLALSAWPDGAARAAEPARLFRAGAHAIDITPTKFPVIVNGGFEEATADQAHDRLHARCLVMDDGESRVAIAVVDSCVLPRELLDAAKELARGATGIPTERMLISATHTHSAPSVMGCLGSDADPDYTAYLPGRIAEGIDRAARNLAPARVGWAVALDAHHTHCRRWILRPDKIRTDPFGEPTVRAMMHPGHQNPDFEGPSGPVDPGISILSLQSREGRPVALLANYSMHYVGAPAVSADYYGRFADKLPALIQANPGDPPFVAMLSQGTSGDQQWMDYSRPATNDNMDTIAEGVARIVADACRRIEYRDWAPLVMRERKMTLGVRLPGAERLDKSRQIVARIQGRKPRGLEEIYAREQVLLAERPQRELKLQALRVGDLGIAAMPCEVFAITGLKIKARSPLQPTFSMSLANGEEGYIPPPAQHRLGGYTTWPARTAQLEVGAEPRITAAMLELLEEVAGRPPLPDPREPHPELAYAQAVLASKPLAYWPLDEYEGPSATGAAGQGKPGLYEGGVAFYLEGPPLRPAGSRLIASRAVHFAGGWLDTPNDIHDRYGVELWFSNYLPADARPVTGCIVSRGPSETLCIGGTSGSPGRLVLATAGSTAPLVGTTVIEPKRWYHLAWAREGGRVAVYLNGKPEMAGETPAATVPGRLSIAGDGRSPFTFEGRIDEVALFDRPLSAEEIARHWAAGGME